MGSTFSKRKKHGETKRVNSLAGKNIPRRDGSTLSLDFKALEVTSSPNRNEYDKSQNRQILPRNQFSQDDPNQIPSVPARMTMHVSLGNLPVNSYQRLPPTLPPRSRGKSRKALTDSVRIIRAKNNYEANYDSDISFRKGDILQLINEKELNGWYFVRNLSTSIQGYAHKDWVTAITNEGVESQKYFYKGLTKEEAEKILLEPDVTLGTYLLRPRADGYALSLRCKNEFYELDIRHYQVRVDEEGSCRIEADSSNKTFSNITDLIRFYTDSPGLRCKLTTPLLQGSSLNDLAVKFSDLKLEDVIGSGQFGTVYAGILHNDEPVAVKSLRDGGSMTMEEFRKEAETMHKLRHKNLVALLAICEDSGQIYIITEKMSKGALLTLLRGDTGNTIKTISFKDLMHMAIQVLEGMCYLEKKAFAHRDLRAANVLVGDGNITKIADFGLARLLDRHYERVQFYQAEKDSGFPYKWTAPEAVTQKRFTIKSDVWSFGILLYEMMTHGDEPYAAMSNHEALVWIEQGNRLKRPTSRHCPMTLYNIMRQCWMKNPEDRPNFADIKETLTEIRASG